MDGRPRPVFELMGLLPPGSAVLLLPGGGGAFEPVPGVPLDTVSPRSTKQARLTLEQ